MEWETLRAAYEACLEASGLSQKTVAAVGGLGDQNSVSRLISNHKLGPQVETFVRAIEGLGMKPSEFFRRIETGAKPAVAQPLGKADSVETVGPEGEKARIFRWIGEAAFAYAADAAARPRADRSSNRTRPRKPKPGR